MVKSPIKCMDCGVEESSNWMRCNGCMALLCINCGNRGKCPICYSPNMTYE